MNIKYKLIIMKRVQEICRYDDEINELYEELKIKKELKFDIFLNGIVKTLKQFVEDNLKKCKTGTGFGALRTVGSFITKGMIKSVKKRRDDECEDIVLYEKIKSILTWTYNDKRNKHHLTNNELSKKNGFIYQLLYQTRLNKEELINGESSELLEDEDSKRYRLIYSLRLVDPNYIQFESFFVLRNPKDRRAPKYNTDNQVETLYTGAFEFQDYEKVKKLIDKMKVCNNASIKAKYELIKTEYDKLYKYKFDTSSRTGYRSTPDYNIYINFLKNIYKQLEYINDIKPFIRKTENETVNPMIPKNTSISASVSGNTSGVQAKALANAEAKALAEAKAKTNAEAKALANAARNQAARNQTARNQSHPKAGRNQEFSTSTNFMEDAKKEFKDRLKNPNYHLIRLRKILTNYTDNINLKKDIISVIGTGINDDVMKADRTITEEEKEQLFQFINAIYSELAAKDKDKEIDIDRDEAVTSTVSYIESLITKEPFEKPSGFPFKTTYSNQSLGNLSKSLSLSLLKPKTKTNSNRDSKLSQVLQEALDKQKLNFEELLKKLPNGASNSSKEIADLKAQLAAKGNEENPKETYADKDGKKKWYVYLLELLTYLKSIDGDNDIFKGENDIIKLINGMITGPEVIDDINKFNGLIDLITKDYTGTEREPLVKKERSKKELLKYFIVTHIKSIKDFLNDPNKSQLLGGYRTRKNKRSRKHKMVKRTRTKGSKTKGLKTKGSKTKGSKLTRRRR